MFHGVVQRLEDAATLCAALWEECTQVEEPPEDCVRVRALGEVDFKLFVMLLGFFFINPGGRNLSWFHRALGKFTEGRL
jgi:hypothetical protein